MPINCVNAKPRRRAKMNDPCVRRKTDIVAQPVRAASKELLFLVLGGAVSMRSAEAQHMPNGVSVRAHQISQPNYLLFSGLTHATHQPCKKMLKTLTHGQNMQLSS